MAKVTERYTGQKGQERGLVTICDFSPPRGADRSVLERLKGLEVDFISVAYNPSKSVRVDSATVAYVIKQEAGKDVVFNLATRDMNRLALQSHLLGAQMLGLENVCVVRGDDFTERERALVSSLDDLRPTEFIASIAAMNGGTDFRGLKLRVPTNFCVGATIDMGRAADAEARLTHHKIVAGTHFFITQVLYRATPIKEFHDAYCRVAGHEITVPVFYGLPLLEKDSLPFGDVPAQVQRDLDLGRSGTDIALEQLHAFLEMGIRSIYLVPPILRGGLRKYEAVQRFLEQARRL